MGLFENGRKRAKDEATSYYEDLILRVGRTLERSANVSRPLSPKTIPRIEKFTQTDGSDVNPAPGNEKPGPLRLEEEKSTSVRVEKMEHLLGKMLETQLQDSARRKRALKARRRRERKRLCNAASFKQQPSEFPSALPHGPPQIVGTVDIPPTAAVLVPLPPTEDWVPPGTETEGRTGPAAGNRETEGPAEAGDSERPRKSDISSQVNPVLSDKSEEYSDSEDGVGRT
jgi:hypothetical protein